MLLHLLSYLCNFITGINGSFASRYCCCDQKPFPSTFIHLKSSQHFLWREISYIHLTDCEQLLQMHSHCISEFISNSPNTSKRDVFHPSCSSFLKTGSIGLSVLFKGFVQGRGRKSGLLPLPLSPSMREF